MSGLFDSMFGKISPKCCRLTVGGNTAVSVTVKDSDGSMKTQYRYYNPNTGSLVNCTEFAFDLGTDCFFVIPTNHPKKGDIILSGGKPYYVLDPNAEGHSIKAINYEDQRIENILPEHHVFLGNTYFYGKIVSMFGNVKTNKGNDNLMKFWLMSQMMKGTDPGNSAFGGNNMMLAMMMSGNGSNLFDGIMDAMDFDKLDADASDDKADEKNKGE